MADRAKVPPHDLDAEAAVLSAVLLEREALDVVALVLQPEHFYSEANRRIFEAAVELSVKGSPVDIVTVAGALRERERLVQCGGAAYLAQLVDSVPSVAHVETYAETIREKWRLRRVISECQRIAAEGYGPIADIGEFIDRAEHALYQISSESTRTELKTARQAADESWEQIKEASKRDGRVHRTTGLQTLDRKTGGLHDSEVTVVAARPGMGKTSLVLQIAESIAETGAGVVIFELEMPSAQLVKRRVASMAAVELGRITDGFIRREEWGLLSAGHNRFGGLPIWIDDTPGLSLLQFRAKVRRVQAECKRRGIELGLAIVDYLQLMEAPNARNNSTRDEDVSQLTRGIKRIAREVKIPILEVSQLNRSLEKQSDKRPGLADLRESGAIEQDADNVLFIYRPDYYLKEKTPDDDKGVAELIIEKQRNRGTGTVRVRFDGPTVTFSDMPVPDPEDEPYYQRSLYQE